MKVKNAVKTRIRRINIARNRFYMNARTDNSRTNLFLLKLCSIVATVMVPLLIFITPAIIKDWKPTPHYTLMIPAMLAFVVFSLLYSAKNDKNPRVINVACVLFYITIMGFVMSIDIFPYPNSGSTFVPVFLIVMPVVFILRMRIVLPLEIVSEIVYIILVSMYKSAAVAGNDIFSSIVGLMFSFIVAYTVIELRVKDNNAKMLYKEMSMMDMLTGTFNKITCENLISGYLMTKDSGTGCAMLVIDLDDFKSINDKYGHKTGDEALKKMGRALRSAFRSSDTVGRIGGDEFIAFARDISPSFDIMEKCREIRELYKKNANGAFDASFSVGISVLSSGDCAYERMFTEADKALYEAKAAGKSRSVIKKL